MKKIIYFLSVFMLTLSMQSCLHDDDEVFDTPTAQRIANAVKDTKALLESSPNGWLLQYYTGKEYSGGGYNMLMKFTDGRVDVSSDIAPADSVSHSSWDIKTDQGIVLSIDTYNEIFHAMSNPSAAAINGQEADYEFVVLRQTQDSIFVRGKKFGDKMVMTRIPESTSWKTYLTETQNAINSLGINYKTTAGTMLTIDGTARQLTVGDAGIPVPFRVTPDALVFPETVEIDGKEVSSLKLDVTTGNMSSDAIGSIEYILTPLTQLVENGTYFITPENISPAVEGYCNKIVAGLRRLSVKSSLPFIVFGKFLSTKWAVNTPILQNNQLFVGYVEYDLEAIDDNTIKLTNGTLSQYNASLIYKDLGGADFYDMFGVGTGSSSTWKLSTDNPKKPSYIRMENAANANEYFIMVPEIVNFPFGE